MCIRDRASFASDARSQLHVLQQQRGDDALKGLEDEALNHMKAARDGERDYVRALEVLGADATAEQKAAVEAVEKAHAPERDSELVARLGARAAAAGPDKKHELYAAWKRKRDAYVKARKAVLRPMPREACLLYTSPSPRDRTRSRMPSSA